MNTLVWIRRWGAFVALSLSVSALQAQDPRLANQYYDNGEYEKAAALYEKLYQQNAGDLYFNRYVECLMSLRQFGECEKVLLKEIKKEPKKGSLYVTYGNLYERMNQPEQAEEQYRKAIDKLPPDHNAVVQLASSFTNQAKYDLAIEVYEKGADILRNKQIFAFNLAELYRRKDDVNKMIAQYLNSLEDNPGYLVTVETYLQRNLDEESDYQELMTQLFARIQEKPQHTAYPELLIWIYLQRKDYKNAFRQAKALDRQLEENGGRVFNIAEIAANDKDYDAAISGYDYVIAEKGPASSFYIDAKRKLLNCKRNKLVEGYEYSRDDLSVLEDEYEAFLSELGKNRMTATIVAELADLEAYYLNHLGKATDLLSGLIDYPGIDRLVQARAKISLGDFYLMQGEIWEATLLYSQVDKAFKDDMLGHEARFRNAKLSYYAGDFEWAQSQFGVLKSSTSKLIANDALDLSVFIMDNMGLDTSEEAMLRYAEAELLVFQNRFAEAFARFDSIEAQFPEHSLEDDILYLEAQIYRKQRNYEKAIARFEDILQNHADGIRADNSLFEMAELYENQLKNPDKARELYEKLFMDMSGSTYAVEARKRYRALRGDKVR